MRITDRGYSFATSHSEDGDIAHVNGKYRRFQTQAPLRRNQPYELEFYGRGAGLTVGVTAIPRQAAPSVMAAVRRRSPSSPRHAAADRGTPTPTFRVGPEFNDPFEHDWIDWDVEPPTLPPPDLPPDGGGGGGFPQSAVKIELFMFGTAAPIETWNLPPEDVAIRERTVTYSPVGFPTADAPVWRTTWWRVVVTPTGPDPVEIAVAAYVRIADVPIRTTSLAVRLTNHIFRVALEALVPQAEVDWDTLKVSIGPEIADLLNVAPTLFQDSISPGNSHAQLRSLDITTVSGRELKDIALEHYRERAGRYAPPNYLGGATLDQLVKFWFESELVRLSAVKPDDVCLRIQAAFTDASVSVWGFDVASLRGELGELILAFDHRAQTMRPFAFLDVDFTSLASIALDIIDIFTEVPRDVNALIEDHLGEHDTQQQVLQYLKAFLARAVGQSSTFHEFKLVGEAWRIRHSDDPVIPRPGAVRPNFDIEPGEGGGMIGLIARHSARLGFGPPPFESEIAVSQPTEPVTGPAVDAVMVGGPIVEVSAPEPAAETPPEPTPASTRTAAPARLPAGFLTEGEQLTRLDRHQSIVVVMMENRSYDHMLGDLKNARPRPGNPYEGPPRNVQNAGVAGFLHGVPFVHTRDLHLGTAIPVSPRHSFDPVQFQIGDGTEGGVSTGDMLGFARDLYLRSDSPQLACTIYGEAELPVHYKLADEFLTCERWFAAHPGPTWPNRFAMAMGSIPDVDNLETDDPRIGYLKGRTIYDALSDARIEWRVFESDLSLVRTFDRHRLNNTNVLPINDQVDGLEATLRKVGPLPRVMFIEPNFADIPPLKTADDDHPPADLAHGQAFLSRVCDLIWDTGRFDEVLLVITYDEHGGFYDHVPPPGTPRSGLGPYPPLIAGGPTWLGVRVPTFVVSPYVSAGAISRTIFDHTSILKTILVHNRDRLSDSVLLGFGERVNQAADLSAVLDLPTPRQAPVPFVRRATQAPRIGRFGDVVDLESITDMMVEPTDGHTPPGSGVTPRDVIVTERTVPPSRGASEPGDFHAALADMLKPRRLQ